MCLVPSCLCLPCSFYVFVWCRYVVACFFGVLSFFCFDRFRIRGFWICFFLYMMAWLLLICCWYRLFVCFELGVGFSFVDVLLRRVCFVFVLFYGLVFVGVRVCVRVVVLACLLGCFVCMILFCVVCLLFGVFACVVSVNYFL